MRKNGNEIEMHFGIQKWAQRRRRIRFKFRWNRETWHMRSCHTDISSKSKMHISKGFLCFISLSFCRCTWITLLMTFVIDFNFHIFSLCASSLFVVAIYFNLKWKSRPKLKLNSYSERKSAFQFIIGGKSLYKLLTKRRKRNERNGELHARLFVCHFLVSEQRPHAWIKFTWLWHERMCNVQVSCLHFHTNMLSFWSIKREFRFCHSTMNAFSFYCAINFTFVSLQNIFCWKCELT